MEARFPEKKVEAETRRLICQAMLFTERIEAGDFLSEGDKLAIESLLRIRCEHVDKLGEAYTSYCVKEWQEKKGEQDPVTNEEDRKSERSRRDDGREC